MTGFGDQLAEEDVISPLIDLGEKRSALRSQRHVCSIDLFECVKRTRNRHMFGQWRPAESGWEFSKRWIDSEGLCCAA